MNKVKGVIEKRNNNEHFLQGKRDFYLRSSGKISIFGKNFM